MSKTSRIHADARIEDGAAVGPGSTIWAGAHLRSGAVLGSQCTVGTNAFIDAGVMLGDRCKIQNLAMLYAPAVLGSGVFIGPAVVLTNDVYPRAVSPEGDLLAAGEWTADGVTIGDGASIGARSVVVAGRSVGRWALVGAGAVVTRDVADYALVLGNPARWVAWVGRTGRRLLDLGDSTYRCPDTDDRFVETDGRLRVVD